jgi:hypothetical protein
MTMTPKRVREIVEAYGADSVRWPVAERDAALAMVRTDEALAAFVQESRRLDVLLDQFPPPLPRANADDLARQIAAAAQEMPARRDARDPAVDWRRWFGWPKLAGLAMAGLIGFTVGWSGLDSRLGDWAAPDIVALAPAADGLEPALEVEGSWRH